MIRLLTAGESHGRGIIAVIEGFPSGVPLDAASVNSDLKRRQGGYGRGKRMLIEADTAEFISGVRSSVSTGGPVCILVRNRDWENWSKYMDPLRADTGTRAVKLPRPGHADLAGGQKYGERDLRNILERASARETAGRVAAGSVFKQLLARVGITVTGYVAGIGTSPSAPAFSLDSAARKHLAASPFYTPHAKLEKFMKAEVDRAVKNKDTVGGIIEVQAEGVPPGLGSHAQWDRKIDGLIALAFMSIQGIKGVEIGKGFSFAGRFGSGFHDAITGYDAKKGRFLRATNNAGGIEGGITNGENIVVRAFMKPIPTLLSPLSSVDIDTKKIKKATVERSDICAVPAASVVGEAALAHVLACTAAEKFGGDSLKEFISNFRNYLKRVSAY